MGEVGWLENGRLIGRGLVRRGRGEAGCLTSGGRARWKVLVDKRRK